MTLMKLKAYTHIQDGTIKSYYSSAVSSIHKKPKFFIVFSCSMTHSVVIESDAVFGAGVGASRPNTKSILDPRARAHGGRLQPFL